MTARRDAADLSHWNSEDDFETARKHLKGVWHKATESTNYTDPTFARRKAAAAKAGMPFGAYHFARPGSARAQAKRFLAVAQPRHGDLRPMLDLEDADMGSWSVAKRTAWVKTWVRIVKKATGEPPLIYTRFDLAAHFDCPLWVARYSNAMSAPRVPRPWKAWSIWQYTNGVFGRPSSVPGFGHCDLNTFNSGVSVAMLTLGETAADKPQAAPKPPKHDAAKPKVPKQPAVDSAIASTDKAVSRAHGHRKGLLAKAASFLRHAKHDF